MLFFPFLIIECIIYGLEFWCAFAYIHFLSTLVPIMQQFYLNQDHNLFVLFTYTCGIKE
jgi:hypothetical protein